MTREKASEILKDLETLVANLEIDNYNNNIQLARLTDDRDNMLRKVKEYKQMLQLSKDVLKKIANSLKHFNASQSSVEQLRDKIKIIRILLEDYSTRIAKKDYKEN